MRMKGSDYTLRDGEWDIDTHPAAPPAPPRRNPAALHPPDAETYKANQKRIDLLTDLLMPLDKVSQ
jgi:hypothetical protein